jgi:hypothetical protein
MLSAGAQIQAIYKECNMSRVLTPPVRVSPRASAFSAGTAKLISTLLAQANTSSSYSQQWKKNTKSTNVEIPPPRYKGGGANTGSSKL